MNLKNINISKTVGEYENPLQTDVVSIDKLNTIVNQADSCSLNTKIITNAIYTDTKTELSNSLPNLEITYLKEYIGFKDKRARPTNINNIENLLNMYNIGDGVGITISNCNNVTSNIFLNGFSARGITSFDEFLYFTGIPSTIGRENCSIPTYFMNNTTLTSIKFPNLITTIYGYGGYNDGNAEGLFRGCTNLTSVTLPTSLTYLGGSTFSGCTSLKTITLPNTIEYIDGLTFYLCTNLENILLPSNLKKIGRKALYSYIGAFCGCSKLTSVEIPASVTLIYLGFGECTNLLNVILHEGLSIIGGRTFINCPNLTTINIPSTVTNIGDAYNSIIGNVFTNDSKLSNVSITDLDKWLSTDISDSYSNPITYSKKLLLNGSELTSFSTSIPVIKQYVLYNLIPLTSVTLNSGVTTIGKYAFYNTRLTSITMPTTITSIGDYAFGNCSNLTTVRLECASVPTITANTFPSTTLFLCPTAMYDSYAAASVWSDMISRFTTY